MSSGLKKPNRLIHETSPYLLQHAYNPVDWYPWGPEAFKAAKDTDRPILLSIGYSSCHWCHVMERESFENEAIAEIMNREFICIKVDREERPDVDEIYMQATVALNKGNGGWPMTVFLTPDQKPFFAGTYFPPEDRWGRPGFGTLLRHIAAAWKNHRADLYAQAQALTEQLKQAVRVPSPISVGETSLEEAVAQFKEEFDPIYGGFGSAPKFPPATGLSLLLRCYRRSGDPHTLAMVTKTLDTMAAGGIYDHIGGGFARYSTDNRWLIPHFEKMLYDNALLARIYLEAYQVTHKPVYRQIATETLDYVLREMTSPDGGFFSATDADSEGVEGKFFVWTPAEVLAAVRDQEDARRFCALYDITEEGNWEHKSIPNRLRPIETVAKTLNVTPDELLETETRVKPILYQARRQRVPPALDDKIITAWNGMMISAFSEAARVLANHRYREAAEQAATYLLRTHVKPDGRLLRTSRAGRAHLNAYLEDYAFLAEGLLDLYEAGADEQYLHAAARLADLVLQDFHDETNGGFFTTARDHEALLFRTREGHDGAIPSANAVAASILARLSFHLDRRDWRDAAISAIRLYGRQIARYPKAFAKTLCVLDFLTEGPIELAFVGNHRQPEFQALWNAVAEIYLPNRIIATLDPATPSSLPLLQGKQLVQGKPALYVCRHFCCLQPLTDPRDVRDVLTSPDNTTDRRSRGPTILTSTALTSYATAEGTASYAARTISRRGNSSFVNGFTTLGTTGLTVTRLGFGTYRIHTQNAAHREALKKALRTACNLIDTSTNYMDGDSERLVGSVLAELITAGDLRREEVIIVSKIGYIQGQTLKYAEIRERSGRPYPDIVKYEEGVWHTIHPDFLADQLTQSLDRLGLSTLDVCLLHNPEYFLLDAVRRGEHDLAALHQVFYGRITQAFAYFESQVAAGRLQWYGVSSNTLASPPEMREAVSLAALLEAAQTAASMAGSSTHHFRVIQFPMNLFESGSAPTANAGQGCSQPVLELASQHGLAVLVNRPLNAMLSPQGGLVRLADLPLINTDIDVDRQLDAVATIEQEYRQALAPALRSNQSSGSSIAQHPLGELFNWAEELRNLRSIVRGMEEWEQIEQQVVIPRINQALRLMAQQVTEALSEQWESWSERYAEALNALLRGLRQEAIKRSRSRTAVIHQTIDLLIPEAHRHETLSRKALWIVASTPGVTCVLNGMRTPAYVDDSLAILGWERFSKSQTVYEHLKSLSI
ncbi:MAG: aldo/keto reductase [Nitrospira sp.]